MDADSFNDLALRVIAGEATDAERHALETEIAGHPARRDEYEQLKITHDVLRAASPMIEAARATEPELPAYRVNELRTAVRQHFGPAVQREKSPGGLATVLRWIFAGGGATALVILVVVLNLSNRTIEVGVYRTDQMRSDEASLSAQDVPSAKLISFDQDAPFDQWQSQPLAWYERAKIWVDNEHDLLHVVRRVNHGQISRETYPLAATNDGQREQIRQVVESLKN
jgi:anti-sigma factor RsiW